MWRHVLKSKIHRAVISDAALHYQGSLTLDPDLMRRAEIAEYEKVLVVDISNGERFDTYVIRGKKNSGEVCVNGAAARLVQVGDRVIIMSFAMLTEKELISHRPVIVKVNEKNRPVS